MYLIAYFSGGQSDRQSMGQKNAGVLTTNSIFFANNFLPTKLETSIHSTDDTANYACHLDARSTSYEWVQGENTLPHVIVAHPATPQRSTQLKQGGIKAHGFDLVQRIFRGWAAEVLEGLYALDSQHGRQPLWPLGN